MSEIMALIKQAQDRSGLTDEKFAHAVGLTSTTYSRQNNSRQNLGLETLRLYAKYARLAGDAELLNALGAYALGMEPDEVTIKPSN